jgi:hypothetical protein
MSTRANVIIKESYSYRSNNGRTVNRSSELIFYRHHDGYPEGTLPTLNIFLDWIRTGKIRKDLSQSAGWLIVLGAVEYASIPKYKLDKDNKYADLDSIEPPQDWKSGSYELTTQIHGDIEYLYTIDLNELSIKIESVSYNINTDKQIFTEITSDVKN